MHVPTDIPSSANPKKCDRHIELHENVINEQDDLSTLEDIENIRISY